MGIPVNRGRSRGKIHVMNSPRPTALTRLLGGSRCGRSSKLPA